MDAQTALFLNSSETPELAEVPEWVHLLPMDANGVVSTIDARGPYTVENAQEVIDASFAVQPKLPIDEAHVTDSALKQAAPARGWITGMEVREDGIWGKVDWTNSGRALLEDRAYAAISPVTQHARLPGGKAGPIIRLSRASLVNNPNLDDITRLNSEEHMDFMGRLKKALKLGDDASEDDVISAIAKMGDGTKTETHAEEMSEIAVTLGLAKDADAPAIVAAAKTAKTGDGLVTQLQSQVATLTSQIEGMEATSKTEASRRFVEAEIAKGRPLVASKEHWVELHAADPERTEKTINALPLVAGQVLGDKTPPAAEITELNAAQKDVARQLGISEEDFLATLKKEQAA